MNRIKQQLDAVIDWVQVTFKETDIITVMTDILQFDRRLMTYENHGRFRYSGKWVFSGIEILTSSEIHANMGIHLYMTGSACKSFEIYLAAQKRTWFDFFKDCLDYGGMFTRLDIAIDDRKPYFRVGQIGQKISAQECVSKFRNWTFINSGTTTGEKTGCTVNLGARESACSMVFYEKNYEQSQKTGMPVEAYGDWNRYEIRLRKKLATSCVRTLIEKKNLQFVGLEIINYYLRIVVRSNTDENRSRWETWQPWQHFIDGTDKLKLSMRPAPRTLEQKKQWIEKYIAPTLKMIQLADDNLGEEFLKSIIDNVSLKENQRRLVEDYLFSRQKWHENQQHEQNRHKDTAIMDKQGFLPAEDIENPFEDEECCEIRKE